MLQNYSEIKSLLEQAFALLEEESRTSEQKIRNLEKRIEALEEQLRNAPAPTAAKEPAPQPKPFVIEEEDEIIVTEEDEEESTIVEVEDGFWDDDDDEDSEYQWMYDMPGEPVEDVRDAISFNDRINFISELFMEDDEQYELTMDRINEARSFAEVVSEMRAAFDWDEESDEVYRFYMAVRRKFE